MLGLHDRLLHWQLGKIQRNTSQYLKFDKSLITHGIFFRNLHSLLRRVKTSTLEFIVFESDENNLNSPILSEMHSNTRVVKQTMEAVELIFPAQSFIVQAEPGRKFGKILLK